MKIKLSVIIALAISVFSLNANAVGMNFIQLTEDGNGLGESSWSTLAPGGSLLGLSITGHSTVDNPDIDGDPNTIDIGPDVNRFAYLDWGKASPGVCRDVKAPSGANTGSRTNSCEPGSDDNVTDNEYLEFSFDQDVIIKNIWFNNNHDNGLNTGDLVTIGGVDYAMESVGYAPGMVGFDIIPGVDPLCKWYPGWTRVDLPGRIRHADDCLQERAILRQWH